MAKFFGELPDCPLGTTFASRTTLSEARAHRPTQGGISGNGREGADSIVVSGGYEDDEDYGDELIYTGHGATILRRSGRSPTRTSMGLATLAWLVASWMGFPFE